jgi:hypothetical protein
VQFWCLSCFFWLPVFAMNFYGCFDWGLIKSFLSNQLTNFLFAFTSLSLNKPLQKPEADNKRQQLGKTQSNFPFWFPKFTARDFKSWVIYHSHDFSPPLPCLIFSFCCHSNSVDLVEARAIALQTWMIWQTLYAANLIW